MLKQIADIALQLITLTRDVKQSKADIDGLRDSVKELRRDLEEFRSRVEDRQNELTRSVELLAVEISRVRETDAQERHTLTVQLEQERRLLALQLENALLKFERRLPPARPEIE